MSSDTEKTAISAEADLLVAFVNTLDVETGADAIAEPRALAAWAGDVAGLAAPEVDAEGQRRLLALRESLRALLRANNGGEPDPGQLDALREAAARSRYRATLAGERLALEPDGAGLEPLAARLLLAVERLQAAGAWPRLKACPAEDCEWAFFDASRNHSRSWCSMDVCGNKAKTRRYRARRR